MAIDNRASKWGVWPISRGRSKAQQPSQQALDFRGTEPLRFQRVSFCPAVRKTGKTGKDSLAQ
jgi:hypothetical protein